jgi:nucleoside-diphosphate-sugar epimerase
MITNKAVLVTGITGFIGRHLARLLAEQPGISVWGCSKSGGKIDGVQVERVDLANDDGIKSAWPTDRPKFAAIFHLAAVVPTSFASVETEECFFANIIMTKNALALALQDNAKFIYASSTSVYGMKPHKTSLTEETLPLPDNLYSLAKYVGEGLCRIAQLQHGLKTTVLRISAPYGPRQRFRTVIDIFLKQALHSQDLTLFGTGQRLQDFTYVEDVVRALHLAYEKPVSGICNIASGKPITMDKLAQTILTIVPGTKSRIIFLKEPDPQEHYRGEFLTEKAKRELGFAAQVPLIEGLRACLASIRKEGESTCASA